jgi:DNA-binding MarR family transcriptional regulator
MPPSPRKSPRASSEPNPPRAKAAACDSPRAKAAACKRILDPTSNSDLISTRIDDLVGYHIRRVQLMLFKQFDRELDPDMTPATLHMLLIIDENPGLTMSRIAEAHGVDRASLAPAIQKMVRKGWIERLGSPEDKRALMLNCTPEGRARALATLAKCRKLEAELLVALSLAERNELLSLLGRVARSQGWPRKESRTMMLAGAAHER